MIMNLRDRFEDWLINVQGLAPGTAQDYASHINRISEKYTVVIDDLFEPDSIRLDDNTMDQKDRRRWMNALRYYIEFLNQL